MDSHSRPAPVTAAERILTGLLLAPRPVLCAWCPDFDRTDPRNHLASHTICPRCFARLEAEGL